MRFDIIFLVITKHYCNRYVTRKPKLLLLILKMDAYKDRMGGKVKDGIYPAKITSVYIASKKKVIFDLEIYLEKMEDNYYEI